MAAAAFIGCLCTGHGCWPPRLGATFSTNVFVNGLGAHRLLDGWLPHCCFNCHPGVVASGAGNVLINGRPAARIGDSISCGSLIAMGSPTVNIGGSLGALTALNMAGVLAGSLSNVASSFGLTPAGVVGVNGEIGGALLSTAGGVGIAPNIFDKIGTAISTVQSGISSALGSIPSVGDVMSKLGVNNPFVSNVIINGVDVSENINKVIAAVYNTKLTDIGGTVNNGIGVFGSEIMNSALSTMTNSIAAVAPDVVASNTLLPASFNNFITTASQSMGASNLGFIDQVVANQVPGAGAGGISGFNTNVLGEIGGLNLTSAGGQSTGIFNNITGAFNTVITDLNNFKVGTVLNNLGVNNPFMDSLILNGTNVAPQVNGIISDLINLPVASVAAGLAAYKAEDTKLLTLALVHLNTKMPFFNAQLGSILNLPATVAGIAAQAVSDNLHGLTNGQKVKLTQGGLGG